jgi:hypothetical protein
MLTSVVVFYALTAGVAGYVSAALYKIMGGVCTCESCAKPDRGCT